MGHGQKINDKMSICVLFNPTCMWHLRSDLRCRPWLMIPEGLRYDPGPTPEREVLILIAK
jgi:hypothetical protein